MKVFVTQYALTDGILEIEGELSKYSVGLLCETAMHPRYFNGENKNWHRTRESAVKRANEMRVRRIASLKKQIVKLESQAFK